MLFFFVDRKTVRVSVGLSISIGEFLIVHLVYF